MIISRNIKPISYIKANAAEVLREIQDTKSPMIITQNGEAKAVLVDTHSYESLVETVEMLKLLAMGEKEVSEGKLIPQEEVFKSIEKEFGFA